MNFRKKLIIIILEISLIPLVLMSFIFYANVKRQIIDNVFEKLQVNALIEKNHLSDVISVNLTVLEIYFATLAHHFEEGYPAPGSASFEELSEGLLNTKEAVNFIREIFIADPAGIIISSADSKLLGANVSGEEFFKKGLVKNDVSIMKKSDASGLVSRYFVGPIIVDDKTSGVLVFENKAEDIFTLISDYSGLGATGEHLYAKNDGNGNALFLTPTRFNPDAALSLMVAKENISVPAVHAINGEEAVFLDAVDYRGIPVFAATSYLEDVGWGIVIKIDQAEALSPLRMLRNLFIFILAIAALVISAVAVSISRSITAPLRQLTLTANKIADGDLSRSIFMDSKDEIGVLAGSFNKMTQKLKESFANLENKVEKRTRRLELQNEELENLNRAMIGRELKMIELKKEIAELKKKDQPE